MTSETDDAAQPTAAPTPRVRPPLGQPGPSWAGDGALARPRDLEPGRAASADEVRAGRARSNAPGRIGELGLARAPFHLRVAAFVVDELLLSMVLGFVAAAAGVEVTLDAADDFAAVFADVQRQMQGITPLIYATQVLFRWPWNAIGWSPGKRLMGMRVIDAEGAPPGLLRGFVRSLFTLASELPLFAGFLWALFDREGRAWHDHLAKTWVVRTPKDGSPR